MDSVNCFMNSANGNERSMYVDYRTGNIDEDMFISEDQMYYVEEEDPVFYRV